MTDRFMTTLAVAVLVFTNPLVLFAQEPSRAGAWAEIQNLASETDLEITTKDNRSLKGRLSRVSETAITLTAKQATVSLDRTDVQKIYRVKKGSRVKNLLIGAGVGAGGGVGGALALLGATGGSDEAGSILLIGVGVGAGIGTALGLLTGKGAKRTLVYEAR
ncbi:MAG TPA: hypothetical protein VJ302_34620 [Blastocatellia bacterium]|nr:hypothetical protein [Blastocatellia bacterium]